MRKGTLMVPFHTILPSETWQWKYINELLTSHLSKHVLYQLNMGPRRPTGLIFKC